MTFLDEQEVGPCGHLARRKGILLSVYASCLSHEVPRQLAFSVHKMKNDKNSRQLTIKLPGSFSLESEISDAQHTNIMNFTQIRCGNDSINEECLCLPHVSWQSWNMKERIFKVQDKNKKAWYVILVVNDDEKILKFLEALRNECVDAACVDKVLEYGIGKEVPDGVWQSILRRYALYQKQ